MPKGNKKSLEGENKPKISGQQRGESPKAPEINGPKGLEPTRFGDWERKGIVSDF